MRHSDKDSHALKACCFFLVFLICFPAPDVSAEGKEEAVSLDQIDAHMFQNIKSQTGKADAQIYEILGTTYMTEREEQNYGRAILYYKKAVGLNPGLYSSWYRLGILTIGTEEGNESLRKAIEANPEFAPPYYWLAYNHARVRRDKEALSYFEQYLGVADPKDTGEKGRINVATKALAELRTGVDGEELKTIRAPQIRGHDT